MGVWLQKQDLIDAVSAATVTSCFDDSNTGVLNDSAIHAIIRRAEFEVMSYLIAEFGPPPFAGSVLSQLSDDDFLRGAALEYAVAYTFDRHPEYVRSNGKERTDRMDRADKRMMRVQEARQRPPTVAKPPANVGGIVRDHGPRMIVDGRDGHGRSGDF